MRRAEEAITNCPVRCDAFFKFTCEHCGARCTFTEPNQLYESGECHECGQRTEVKVGGFTLRYEFDKPPRQTLS